MRYYLTYLRARILADSKPYDWLENEGSEKTTGSTMFERLFASGVVAALFKLAIFIGNSIFVFFLLMNLIKLLLRAGEPMAKREIKSSIAVWFMCLIAYNSVLGIVGVALWLGGAL